MMYGLHTAIVMPFLNNKIDYKNLEKILDFQYQSGVDGIVLHGTTGEAPAITNEEFIESSDFVLKNWKKKLNITIGISQNYTDDVLRKQDSLKENPYAFLVTPPSYSRPSQEGIFQHFEKIANNTSVPIIIYNVPSRTVSDVLPSTLKRVVEACKNVIAIKDATGSFTRFSEEQFVLRDLNCDFSFLTGDDGTALHFLLSGGNGIVSVLSNFMPKELLKMMECVKKSMCDNAFAIHFNFFEIINLLFVEANPMPIKYIMYKMGFCNLEYRLPMCKPSAYLMEKIDAELKKLSLI